MHHDTLGRIRALFRSGNNGPASDKELVDFLYGGLSVLDQKASGLLLANTLMMAAAGVFHVNFTLTANSLYNAIDLILYSCFWLGLFLLAVSSFLCLKIFEIQWYPLNKAEKIGNSYNFTTELDELEKVVNKRTIRYCVASYLTQIALILLMIWLFFSSILPYIYRTS